MLEPLVVKATRAVPRREGRSNPPDLSDDLANGEEAKLSILAYADFIGTKEVNSSVSMAQKEINYTNSNASANVTVIQMPTNTAVDNVTARPGDNVTIPVNVTADDKLPVNGNVTVILPDGSNQTAEIINGTGNVEWTVPDDYVGDYPVNVTFDGDNYYLPSNATGVVTVEKVPTEIKVDNVTVRPGNNVIIPINVTAGDDVPFNGEVNVILPDGSNQTVVIVDGEGNVTWTVPDSFKEGDYPVNVTFDGDNYYLPSNGTDNVNVIPKTPVNIVVGNVTAKPGTAVNIPINVIPEDGSVFNGNVTVTFPDATNKAVEVINGNAAVDWIIPDNYNGTYPVTVTFDGDDTYLMANGGGFITVVPDTPVTPDTPDTPDTPVNPPVKEDVPMDTNATGNPLVIFLIALALLGVNTRRKK